jgi:uncharacterized membrane protein
MATIEKSIDVRVPVSVAYGQWTQFEEFPRFMEGVEKVVQIDDTHLHWVAEIGGERREWDAEIVKQEPDRMIAWRSTGGTPTMGRVEFRPIDEGTRISVQMEHETEGLKERMGSFFGADEGQVEDDLERFRELVEGRGTPTDEWRGRVEGGRVVGDDAR